MSAPSQRALLLSHRVAEFERRVNALLDYAETHPPATLGELAAEARQLEPGLLRPGHGGTAGAAFPGTGSIPPAPVWWGGQVQRSATAEPGDLREQDHLAAGLLLL